MHTKLILAALAGLLGLGAIAWFVFSPDESAQTAAPAVTQATSEATAAAPAEPGETAAASEPSGSSEATAVPTETETADAPDAPSGPPGGAKRDLGWMHGNCLVAKADLADGAELTIITLGDPQTVIRGQVTGKVSSDDDCRLLDGLRRQNNAEQGDFYVVEARTSFDYATAVIHPEGVGPGPDPTMLDVNEDDVLDSFTQCITAEGPRFSVWAAEPYNSKELWRGSYLLEGDKIPNCPPGS